MLQRRRPLCLIAIIVFVGAAACSEGKAPLDGESLAPELRLPMAAGGIYDTAQLDGKKVVVNFWSPD